MLNKINMELFINDFALLGLALAMVRSVIQCSMSGFMV